MIIKIKREECLANYPKFPVRWFDPIKEEIDDAFPTTYRSYIFTLQSKSFKGHVTLLAKEITNLVKDLSLDNLIFLGDTETAWRYQSNDFKPVNEALQYLADNKIGKNFNGALQVQIEILPTFLKHLSWLSRCNASLPYFYFTDIKQNLIGTICQYGNLHIDTVNKQTDSLFKNIIASSKLQLLIGQSCNNNFSKTGAIKHRQITL
jgi:hypothetical protein